MFGGLEVKGSEKKEEKPAQNSGFSFMSTGAPAGNGDVAAADTAKPASGFGFMSPTAPASAAAAAPSSFSFMQAAEQAKEEEAPAAPSSSGFDFMGAATSSSAPNSEPPAGSGFSFVGGATDQPAEGGLESSATIASNASTAPTGAGITFGGASAKKTSIKRRTRAPKVGAGVSAYSAPPPVPPVPIQPSTSYGSVQSGSDASNTKDKAEEAARRAEEFLQTKMQEQSRLGSFKPPDGATTGVVDDELEEARRAAESAQARLAKEAAAITNPGPPPKSGFSWFGRNSAKSESSMIPSPMPSQHPQAEESEVDRILREQEEIKLAMAERNLQHLRDDEETKEQDVTVWNKPDTSDVPVIDTAPSWQKPASQLSPPSVPSWGVRAPAPPPPTPRQLLEIILQQFGGDVQRAMEKVGNLRQQRNMLLEERFVALAKERLAVQQIVQTETQQMDAAENEDFDYADRLQVVLDGHNREKAECSAILENISRALSELDKQTPSVVNGVAQCFQRVETELKDFQKKQVAVEREDGSENMKRFGATAKQLSTEEERLRGDSKALEREEELVTMERKELDAVIGDQTSELDTERAESKTKLEQIEKDLDDLREQIRLKEGEAQHLRTKIQSNEVEVSKILGKFTRQITRVQKKEQTVGENRKEWDNEKNAYDKLKEAHEAEVKAHSEALLQHNVVMDILKVEIGMATKISDIVSEEVTFEHIREENAEADGDLAQLQADVVKCEAAVADASSVVKSAEATVESLTAEHKELEENLPVLEERKKDAAAKRDFKTAGKASKEIKEANSRIQEIGDSLLEEAKQKVDTAKIDLKKVQQELDKEKASSNEKEKEAGLVTMKKIADRIKALLETKQSVCGKVNHDTVKGVGALVLQGQIDALKHEGENLGQKFGGWEEIAADFDEIEESDEEKDPSGEKQEAKEEKKSSRPSDEVIKDNVEKARELTAKLAEAEETLEAAVADEDFEKAAELDELFNELKTAIEVLDLTDAETELVLSGEAATEVEDEDPDEGANEVEQTASESVEADPEPDSTDAGSAAESSEEKQTICEEEEAKVEDDQKAEDTVEEPDSSIAQNGIDTKEGRDKDDQQTGDEGEETKED